MIKLDSLIILLMCAILLSAVTAYAKTDESNSTSSLETEKFDTYDKMSEQEITEFNSEAKVTFNKLKRSSKKQSQWSTSNSIQIKIR